MSLLDREAMHSENQVKYITELPCSDGNIEMLQITTVWHKESIKICRWIFTSTLYETLQEAFKHTNTIQVCEINDWASWLIVL